jgi:hypothetical protein
MMWLSPIDLDPLCERPQMVAPVAAFGVAHPLARLSGECAPRLRRERRPGLSISAAAAEDHRRTLPHCFVSNPLMAP